MPFFPFCCETAVARQFLCPSRRLPGHAETYDSERKEKIVGRGLPSVTHKTEDIYKKGPKVRSSQLRSSVTSKNNKKKEKSKVAPKIKLKNHKCTHKILLKHTHNKHTHSNSILHTSCLQ